MICLKGGWFLVFATLSFSASKTVWLFVVVVAIQGLELLKDQNPGAREDAAGDQRFLEFFWGGGIQGTFCTYKIEKLMEYDMHVYIYIFILYIHMFVFITGGLEMFEDVSGGWWQIMIFPKNTHTYTCILYAHIFLQYISKLINIHIYMYIYIQFSYMYGSCFVKLTYSRLSVTFSYSYTSIFYRSFLHGYTLSH